MTLLFLKYGYSHSSAGRSILDAVIQKVGEQALDHPDVNDDLKSFRCLATEGYSLIFSAGTEQIAGVPNNDRNVDLFQVEPVHTSFCFGNQEHGVDHAEQTIAFLNSIGCHSLILTERLTGGQCHLSSPAYPGDRTLQVMGDIVRHLFELSEQLLYAVQHLIKRDGELIDLVAPRFHRHTFFYGAL